MTMINGEQQNAFNVVAKEVYQISADHGFHDGETASEVTPERMGMFCANLHGEVSELWESCRRGTLHKQCDKDVPLSEASEELADIIIRAMDTAVALRVNIGVAIALKSRYNESRAHKHGKNC
jgi:NTP pyrophosphatase (non-canonical NTP hydrolase)